MRLLLVICLGISLIGCGNSYAPDKPENLISKDNMSDIIYDVFVLNAAKGINKIILENNGIMPQDFVYKKHNIDSLQFARSNEYYSYDTKTYQHIIDKVKAKLEAEKAKNEVIELQEKKTKDSIKRATIKAKRMDSISIKPKKGLKEFE